MTDSRVRVIGLDLLMLRLVLLLLRTYCMGELTRGACCEHPLLTTEILIWIAMATRSLISWVLRGNNTSPLERTRLSVLLVPYGGPPSIFKLTHLYCWLVACILKGLIISATL